MAIPYQEYMLKYFFWIHAHVFMNYMLIYLFMSQMHELILRPENTS